jgi:hypothetical protein
MHRQILISLALFLLSASGSADSIINEFRGNGIQITRPFSVPDGWEIQWTNQDFLQIFVQPVGEGMLDMAANQISPSSGSSYQPTGGKYYLKINGIGEWVVKVVKVD